MSKITALLFMLPVRELDAAAKFYCDAFDLRPVFQNERVVFVGIPGTDSALGLRLDPEAAGSGPQHVGFHVDHALQLDDVVKGVEEAGGQIVERGEHGPNIPFARFRDPDGNELEI